MIYHTSVIYVRASNQGIIWFAVSVSELLCFSVLWGRLFILWLLYLISASNRSIQQFLMYSKFFKLRQQKPQTTRLLFAASTWHTQYCFQKIKELHIEKYSNSKGIW